MFLVIWVSSSAFAAGIGSELMSSILKRIRRLCRHVDYVAANLDSSSRYATWSLGISTSGSRPLLDAAAEHQVKNVVVSHKLNSGRDISRAMRSQFNNSSHKDRLDDEYDLKGRSMTGHGANDTTEHVLTDVELDIQVQVEQTVTVDYVAAASYDRHSPDTYSGSRRNHDQGHILPR